MKQYAIQNYYWCQHNTRISSPHKDPQRRLEINPTARVKKTNHSFQLVIKIDTSAVCLINLKWEHNHWTGNVEASNFNKLSDESVEKIMKLYEAGDTPSTARQQYLAELKANCKDDIDFHVKKADRSITHVTGHVTRPYQGISLPWVRGCFYTSIKMRCHVMNAHVCCMSRHQSCD